MASLFRSRATLEAEKTWSCGNRSIVLCDEGIGEQVNDQHCRDGEQAKKRK
jgi:hypothetical protein